MRILYGSQDKYKDITEICYKKFQYKNQICIPDDDNNRAQLFGDPIWGTLKKIRIEHNNIIKEYDDKQTIFINTLNNVITILDRTSIIQKLYQLQRSLKIKYGTFYEELPEQKMAATYLTGNEKVLEIGGNIGRNSLIIAKLMGNNSLNYVTLESDDTVAEKLSENRDMNQLKFHIEPSALSKRPLIQKTANMINDTIVISNSDTIISDTVPQGFKRVNNITVDELQRKYDIVFDTLIIDCEGAFYYILQDFPEILDNINLIIMENDYTDIKQKEYIDETLISKQFKLNYFESGGREPCFSHFFEVWKKNI